MLLFTFYKQILSSNNNFSVADLYLSSSKMMLNAVFNFKECCDSALTKNELHIFY